MEFQAVWQKLHGTCELLGALAEGPEHGGGVGARGHGNWNSWDVVRGLRGVLSKRGLS